MRILMLVNWKIEYTDSVPPDKQPPDYDISGQPYWFFRYFDQKENGEYQVDVVDMHSFPWLEKFEQNRIRFYIWQTIKILPKLKKYDLILSHGMQSGIVLCLLRRLFGKGHYKHIVFDIGAFNSAREQGKSLKLMQFASKSLDGVIYHTRIQQQYYEKCHPWLLDKSRFIVFGTDAEYFSVSTGTNENGGEETNSEKTDGAKGTGGDSQPYILSFGYNKRDWATLVAAYQRLHTEIPLRLIGNVSEGNRLSGGDPHICSMPPVPVTELKKQIAGAMFCVLPLESFHYSYGQMTLLQQMAMGKAVIVADVPSVSAYLDQSCNLSYHAGDADELRAQMKKLIEDEELRRLLEYNAVQAVKQRYSERLMAKEIQEIIDEIVNGEKR